jgi:hypothetical protein
VSLFLSSEEVEALTDRLQPKRQIAWLSQHGWRFEVGASGRPKIARSYYESRMGQPEKPKKYRVREEV